MVWCNNDVDGVSQDGVPNEVAVPRKCAPDSSRTMRSTSRYSRVMTGTTTRQCFMAWSSAWCMRIRKSAGSRSEQGYHMRSASMSKGNQLATWGQTARRRSINVQLPTIAKEPPGKLTLSKKMLTPGSRYFSPADSHSGVRTCHGQSAYPCWATHATPGHATPRVRYAAHRNVPDEPS